MRRILLLFTLSGIVSLVAFAAWLSSPTTAQQVAAPLTKPARLPAAPPPVAQVVLFSSGVGYFQREGEVEENARIDLAFPAASVNDLLKSLVLQDLGGGKISAVSYDSQDPVEKTLRSFALDLTANPTFGQILNQARGEKIEVLLASTSTAQPGGTLTGTIVGMEAKQQPHGKDQMAEVVYLNLLGEQGLRSVSLSDVQQVRFLNPQLESEFKRALAVLAGSHDMQKKLVSLSFHGEGKRRVRVGYVVENPIWKTSYRLVLGAEGKAHLQGWAMVENTSDDDWTNVRMALVSGRPISFQMDLYQPLYIPRPTVEPELFASLRPPTYSGAMNSLVPATAGAAGVPAATPPVVGNPASSPAMNSYQNPGIALSMGWRFGDQNTNNSMVQQPLQNNPSRLTFEQLQQRRQQEQAASTAKRGTRITLGRTFTFTGESVTSSAASEDFGDSFQYVIDHKVSLPRQKSALLPIVTEDVQAAKVSIFNEGVHAKFPLLGLRFKNTSPQHLMQGPLTVYEGDTYAGDARILDLQPHEERLLSYAIDLGTEVKAEAKSTPSRLVTVKVVKGVLHATNKLRESKTYLIKNRSEHERALLLEHPLRSDWTLVAPEKPSERSRDVYRFQVTVLAGKAAKQEVIEEQQRVDHIALTSADERAVRLFVTSPASSPKVKEALQKAIELRTSLAEVQRDLAQHERQLKDITDDQTRLRANLEKVPPTSAAYKRYLTKFDTQETEIEQLQGQIKQLQEAVKKQQKGYEEYVAGLSVE